MDMRNVITILLLFLCLKSYTQTISVNKVNQDGSRIVSTDEYVIKTGFTDKTPFLYSIKAYISPDKNVTYYLGFRINSLYSIKIPQNGIILFKTKSGNVIECKQQLDDYKTEDIIGTYVPMTGMRIYSAYGVYPISYEDLLSLSTEGVIKVRVETEIENIDANYSEKKANIFSEELAARLSLINSISTQKNDIREGF
jgi:hypothetical protein|nr:MAG TPA: hypothetical protein [Caudoviricetes sp.]